MELRKAKFNDLSNLVENRIEFINSIANIVNINEYKIHTRNYLQKHLEDNTLISYIAVEEGKIIASCILCIYETLPTPNCLNGRKGLLLNVYTLLPYRRQGLAYNLLTRLIEEAKQLGVSKIQLDYTDDGYPLYKKLGFERLEREMILKL